LTRAVVTTTGSSTTVTSGEAETKPQFHESFSEFDLATGDVQRGRAIPPMRDRSLNIINRIRSGLKRR
jgi:hypothetical protein